MVNIIVTADSVIGSSVQLDDVVYSVEAANNGNRECISLCNQETGFFLRHKGGKLLDTDAKDNPNSFLDDSSWIPVACGDGYILHCSNAGMEDKFICKVGINDFIINSDLVEYVIRKVNKKIN